MPGLSLRVRKFSVIWTTLFEVLEKRKEVASKLSSEKKSLLAMMIPNALLRTSESDVEEGFGG